MKAADVLDVVAVALNDPNYVTWGRQQCMDALYQACLAVVGVRPDAYVVTDTFKLAAGSEQQLPAGGLRLVQPHCNYGIHASAAQSPGSSVRLVDKAVLDEMDMSWRTSAAGLEVYEAVVDERIPGLFFVNPPAPADLWIQASYTSTPPRVTSTGQEIALPEKYLPALVEWVLYLLLGRDHEDSPNYVRAVDHRNTFFNLLGVKTQADTAMHDTHVSG